MDTISKQEMKSFDPTAIKQFSGLTDHLVDALILTFYDELKLANAQMRHAIDSNDWKLARQVIHGMRPGFMMFGEQDAAMIMEELLENGIGSDHKGSIDNLHHYLKIATTLEVQVYKYLSQGE